MRIDYEFKVEYFLIPLFLTLAILTIKYVGFTGVKETIFTLLAIIQVPLSFIAARYCRKTIYTIIRGYGEYED